MRKILILLLAVLVAGIYTTTLVAEGNGHAYIGPEKCGMCHKGEKKGNILEIWQGSMHAQAYATLASDAALAIASEKGIANPQEAPECLKCHVTGYGEDATLTAGILATDGVTCEACHGAGADYKGMKVMKDIEAAKAAGLNPSPRDRCASCHNEESPTFKPFNFDERWAKIAHSLPETTE